MQLRPAAGAPYIGQGELAALDYDAGGRVNRGSLCGKGNMALELLTHPDRRMAPLTRTNGALAPTSWDAALDLLVERLAHVRATDGAASVGILAGPYLTNEEAALAARLARAIGTPHLDLCQPEDRVVLAGLRRCHARPELLKSVDEIDSMRGIIVVGDLFTHAPCIAKPVLNARYDRRGNVLGTVGFWHSRTAVFGKPRLQCQPGRESAALALFLRLLLDAIDAKDPDADLPAWVPDARKTLEAFPVPMLEELSGLSAGDLQWPLDKMLREDDTGVLLGCGFAETERLDLVAGLAALIAELTRSRFLAMYAGANTVGVRRVLEAEGFPGTHGFTGSEMGEACGTGDLKAIISLSADPVGTSPGRVADDAVGQLELIVTTGPFDGATDRAAHIVLPTATWGEKVGSAENAFGDRETLSRVVAPPGSARPDADVLLALCERVEALGGELPEPDVGAPRGGHEEDFFGELELHLRMERREEGGVEVGSHVLFPEFVVSHAGDGWLTRPLSWPRHEMPHPQVAISPAHAAEIGVRAGDMVRVRSRDAQTEMTVRVERRLPDDVVLVPPHFPEVRRLTTWRLDPALRDLDLRPGRVAVEPLEEVAP